MKTPFCLLAAALLLLPAQAAPPAGKDEPRPDLVLPTPDYLPPLARQLLKARMERHGKDQARLVLAVTLLQRERVKNIAGELASEPRIVRPMAGARDELNSSLPERFFVYQDALRVRAKELGVAAASKDDAALARSFGQLVEICVGCHSAFLNPPREP